MQLMLVLRKRLESSGSIGNLPSLGHMLRDLDQYTRHSKATLDEITQCISQDPPLSVRLLRLANSAYYARTEPVQSIEDAVQFLGTAQVRIVSMTSRCIEAMVPKDHQNFAWIEFWRHSIATGHFCRALGEILKTPASSLEISYLVGLMHDVGKLVIAMLSPDAFQSLIQKASEQKISFQAAEQQYSDTDHGALGGWYLEKQNLPSAMFEAVRCHHNWRLAVKDPELAALVNVADFLTRANGIGISGNMEPVSQRFIHTPAWEFLTETLKIRQDTEMIERMVEREALRVRTLVDSILPSPVPVGALKPGAEANPANLEWTAKPGETPAAGEHSTPASPTETEESAV